mmetsp:Transcript_28802/g.88293  ORF Transcript_28802/g.88293 Transcript_28802/m.88293 type:complete len:194 (-) Transcript_28802:3-584(-)
MASQNSPAESPGQARASARNTVTKTSFETRRGQGGRAAGVPGDGQAAKDHTQTVGAPHRRKIRSSKLCTPYAAGTTRAPRADHSKRKTKAQWASAFGIDRQRFTYWEKHMGEETLDRIRRGVVPLPRVPGEEKSDGEGEGEANNPDSPRHPPTDEGELYGYKLEELKKRLQLGYCTRIGDGIAKISRCDLYSK